jgi:uncharacterized protein YprB with RNaseH-like and TPR domain
MKICFFDIETSDLRADKGFMLSWAVLPYKSTKPVVSTLMEEPNSLEGIDKELVTALADVLEDYDMVCGWNSKMFDLPFVNSRLSLYGWPPLKPQFHLDLMYYATGIFQRIGSRSLEAVADFYGIKPKKDHLEWSVWQKASLGDEEALAKVKAHNVKDVQILAKLYEKLLPFVRNIHA